MVSGPINETGEINGYRNSGFARHHIYPATRKQRAAKLGVENAVVLALTNRAPFARVKGIGGVFGNLLAKMMEINTDKKLSDRNPSLKDCESWVSQAEELGCKITY
jgi:hypothetical protein